MPALKTCAQKPLVRGACLPCTIPRGVLCAALSCRALLRHSIKCVLWWPGCCGRVRRPFVLPEALQIGTTTSLDTRPLFPGVVQQSFVVNWVPLFLELMHGRFGRAHAALLTRRRLICLLQKKERQDVRPSTTVCCEGHHSNLQDSKLLDYTGNLF